MFRLINSFFFNIQQHLWKNETVDFFPVILRALVSKESLSEKGILRFAQDDIFDYRQELILAVISRILFCRLVSPLCRANSTFLMA